MSLKYGIYLVEQRIISPEQFCGLVKIQQESAKSMATIALRKNMMTIKQVARVLDIQEATPTKGFAQIVVEEDMLDQQDADELVRAQQISCASIRKLVVECGLLTERQSQVLYGHFQRVGTRTSETQKTTTPTRTVPTRTAPTRPSTPVTQPQQPTESQPTSMRPRRPKFKQRPIVVHPYSQPTNR